MVCVDLVVCMMVVVMVGVKVLLVMVLIVQEIEIFEKWMFVGNSFVYSVVCGLQVKFSLIVRIVSLVNSRLIELVFMSGNSVNMLMSCSVQLMMYVEWWLIWLDIQLVSSVVSSQVMVELVIVQSIGLCLSLIGFFGLVVQFWMYLFVVMQFMVLLFVNMRVVMMMSSRCLWNSCMIGIFVFFLCLVSLVKIGFFLMWWWMQQLMRISMMFSRNGMCQFYVRNWLLGVIVVMMVMILDVRRSLSGMLIWGDVLKMLCFVCGVCLMVISIVLFYLLFVEMFWMMWSSISRIGVVRLMVLQVGSRLISVVVVFIRISVYMRMVLCLSLFLK